jgi:hypothetical protein
VAGGMARGCRGTNSIARRRTPCQAASVRGQSNQVLSEVLRAGRASTAGLSPLSTPDSILMCYPKSRERDQQAPCVEHGWREELWALTRFGAQWVKPRDSGSLAHAPAYFSVKRTASVPR